MVVKIAVKSFTISIVILFLLFVGYQSQQIAISSESSGHVCTACDKGKAGEAVWCDTCNAGFIDGKKIDCKSCFDGKTGKSVWCESCNAGYINAEKISCKGCFDSKTKGTVCETCQKK